MGTSSRLFIIFQTTSLNEPLGQFVDCSCVESADSALKWFQLDSMDKLRIAGLSRPTLNLDHCKTKTIPVLRFSYLFMQILNFKPAQMSEVNPLFKKKYIYI